MLNEVERLNKDGRPVLIGTTNVAMSEQTAKELEERGVPCQVGLIRAYEIYINIIRVYDAHNLYSMSYEYYT